MIVRSFSSPHICLRCRLRLARRSLPSRVPSAFQSTKARRWDLTDESRHDRAPAEEDEGVPLRYPGVYRPLSSSPRAGAEKKLSEFPLGRLYGFRGRKLREQKEDLGINNLGEPSQVIVLRDHGVHYAAPPAIPSIEAEPLEPVDILARLDNERGLVGHQEVMDNIEELRPKERALESWDDFDKLMASLSEGFTVLQLARYIDAHAKSREQVEDGTTDSTIFDGETTVEASSWMPGLSQSIDQFNTSSTRGYYRPEQLTKKERLALLLLRDCWSVSVSQVQEGLGEIEMAMPESELDWLLKGSISPLSSISQRLLFDEKIEASRSRGIVRITSTRARAEIIVSEIEKAARNIQHVRISFKELLGEQSREDQKKVAMSAFFDSRVLSELSRLSGAEVIADSKLRHKVSFVDAADEGLSNRADLVRQLLLASTPIPERSANKLACAVPGDSSLGAFVKSESTSGLDWRSRLRQWTRWTSAAPKTVNPAKGSNDLSIIALAPATESSADDPAHSLIALRGSKGALPISFLSQKDFNQSKGNASSPDNLYWARQYFTGSSVLVGHLLHEGPNTERMAIRPADASLEEANSHAFCANVPNLSRVLRSTGRINSQTSQSIILRFQPSPWGADDAGKPFGYDALRIFPPIEMRFSVDPDTQEMELKEVLATMSTDISDLMLPDQQVDLRFLQETTCRLRSPDRLSAIQEFVEKSRVTNGQPQTPPKLILPIDKHLCNASVRPNLLTSDTEPAMDVKYLYSGHEYRNTMLMNYKGWLLVYNSIQAGEQGGSRGELRLRARRTPMHNPSPHMNITQESESQSYVDTVFDLVNALGEGSGVARITKTPGLVRFIHYPDEKQPVPRGYKYFVRRVDFSGKGESERSEPDQSKEKDPEIRSGTTE